MASPVAGSNASTAAPYYFMQRAPDVNPDLERGIDAASPEEKHKIPWQYYGYPALTKWMASANDFFVLRRFSQTQIRCLLYLQNEIALKEGELRKWDSYAKCLDPEKGNSGRINADPVAGHPRVLLIQELIPLLQQYNGLVHSFSQMKAKVTASDSQVRNIDNWLETYGKDAIDVKEQHWKDNRGDVVTMMSRPKYPIFALLDRSRFISRLFKLKRRDDRVDDESTIYMSNSGLEALATLLTLFVGLGMTFGSIWLLNAVNRTADRLIIITVSGGIMTLIAWVAAGNRPFEILATFAAYMAVLMIYRQVGEGGA